MAKTILGLNAKLYRNTGSFGAPVWSEVKNVKDVTLTLESSEADVSTRDGGGWKAVVAALKDATIEFQMIHDPTDLNYNAIKTAWLNNTAVEFAVLDGAVGTSGSEGLRASMAVLRFSRSENLEEALMAEVSVKPTRADNPPSYMTVA